MMTDVYRLNMAERSEKHIRMRIGLWNVWMRIGIGAVTSNVAYALPYPLYKKGLCIYVSTVRRLDGWLLD